MRIGITGVNGFIGWHLKQYLSLIGKIEIIPFNRAFFLNSIKMKAFVNQCDIIIHLAAVNRHEDSTVLYDTNVKLVNSLIDSCTTNKPKIYFSSSSQEDTGNYYGNSKKVGWNLLREWGKDNNVDVGSFVIPNVFGPFGKPNYNSFIATFCYNIINGKEVNVISDSTVNLIHVHDLVRFIWKAVCTKQFGRIEVPFSYSIQVTKVLNQLKIFREEYLSQGKIPNLIGKFELQLFNMFRTYIPDNHYPVSLQKHEDLRGSFVEIIRANSSGQYSFSLTHSGITRGNHFHTRKAERFAVIKGKARIQLRKIGSNEIINYELDGSQPSYVDMPIWYTHNITNIGNEELITLFWINEPYDANDPDTFFIDV